MPQPDDAGTVRVLLFGGPWDLTSGGGPPIDFPALPDGSPPGSVQMPADGLSTVRDWYGGPVVVATLTDVYTLAPHQHASTQGRAPYRYLWAGTIPVPGIPV